MAAGKKLIMVMVVLFAFITSVWADEIHEAAQKGDLAKVKALLEKNPALVHAKDQQGDTPLQYAAAGGSLPIIELLLSKGAEIEVKNSAGQTPLLYAVYYGHKEAAEFLLAKGAQFTHQDIFGRNPLHYAARNGHKDAVEVLLKHGADINGYDQFGHTPLSYAFYYGRKDVLDLMMEKDTWAKINEDNRGLILHAAASTGDKEFVELLISEGVDINTTNNSGGTLLHSTISGRLNELASQLIAKGIDIRAKDNDGRTALHYAVREGDKELVELLIARGADINLKDSDGRTPLHIADDWNHKDITELLSAKGAKEIPRKVHILKARHPEQRRTETEGQVSSSLEISYIANEGFLISSARQKVLIDSVHKNPVAASTPDDVFKKMVSKQPPFEHINLFLITHAHSDHLEPQMVTEFLLHHPETVLISSETVMEALKGASAENYDKIKPQLKNVNPEFGSIIEMTVNDVEIKVVGLNHNTPENKYLNLGFVINMGGIKLFHSGDTSWQASEEYFQALHLEKEEFDVAFLDQYALATDPFGQRIIKELIQPPLIIPMHIPPMDVARVSKNIKKLYPEALIFKEPMEKKIFKK